MFCQRLEAQLNPHECTLKLHGYQVADCSMFKHVLSKVCSSMNALSSRTVQETYSMVLYSRKNSNTNNNNIYVYMSIYLPGSNLLCCNSCLSGLWKLLWLNLSTLGIFFYSPSSLLVLSSKDAMQNTSIVFGFRA